MNWVFVLHILKVQKLYCWLVPICMDIILDLDQTFEKWCGALSGLVLIAYKPETTLQYLQKLDLFSTVLSGGSIQNLQK